MTKSVDPGRRRTPSRLLRNALAGLALTVLSGCYLLQAAQGQLELNSRRRPIQAVLADPVLPAQLKAQLELVVQLRDYASRSLGLPDNASYRSYADIGRSAVVWNVFAAPEFSTEPVTWCFPVAGCVAYRGYFREARARDYALMLRSRGYDVLVGGVPAYSTLGHFDDPVLSTMMGWSEAQLAAMLFHELAHQVAYAPDDSSFNEAFATAVEREGVRRWFSARHDEPALAAFDAATREHAYVAQMLNRARARLAILYAGRPAGAALRAEKRAEFDRLREEFSIARAQGRVDAGYDWLFGWQLGNASLLAVATYEDCVPAFEQLLRDVEGDLPAFYARATALARLPRAARHELMESRATGTCR